MPETPAESLAAFFLAPQVPDAPDEDEEPATPGQPAVDPSQGHGPGTPQPSTLGETLAEALDNLRFDR